MSDERQHDLHDFIAQTTDEMASEYLRIRRRSRDDPGTAGDDGEENWAELLRGWVPHTYHVVTKGQILSHSGETSPQIDVLVLKPSYPIRLVNKKKYLAAGVAAAFECKNTLTTKHIKEATIASAKISKFFESREGTPYRELCSPMIYGLLAHSHSWKAAKSNPAGNIETALRNHDETVIEHPREQLDLLCVADLACWHSWKVVHVPANPEKFDGKLSIFDYAASAHVGHLLSDPQQAQEFKPVGALISLLLQRLAMQDPSIRDIAEYFQDTSVQGIGSGVVRQWKLDIYSRVVLDGIEEGRLGGEGRWSEWNAML